MAITAKVKNPPQTSIATSHGIQIVAKGIVVGAIVRWSPAAYTRGMTHVFELNYLTSGHPIDVVPGNLGGFKIAVDRYDLWTKKMEEAFFDMTIEEALGMQDRPFEVNQFLLKPDGTKELVVYRGCWFDSIGRTYDATGDRIIKVSASLTFLKRERVL